MTGRQLRKLGEYYAKAIYDNYGTDFDILFGPSYKGIPLAVVTSAALYELYGAEVKYCTNRKEIKDHGDAGIFLGAVPQDGDRVVIIEDVTTSGASMAETVPILREHANVEILGLIVSLNRMEKGRESEKSALDEISGLYGFKTAAIVSMNEVVEYLYGRQLDNGQVLIDDARKAAIDEYYAQYGAK